MVERTHPIVQRAVDVPTKICRTFGNALQSPIGACEQMSRALRASTRASRQAAQLEQRPRRVTRHGAASELARRSSATLGEPQGAGGKEMVGSSTSALRARASWRSPSDLALRAQCFRAPVVLSCLRTAMTYGSPPRRTRGRVRERSTEQRQAHGGVHSRGRAGRPSLIEYVWWRLTRRKRTYYQTSRPLRHYHD